MVDWKAVNLSDTYDYAVFDDFPADRLKSSYKQFMGCQKEFTVTDKYCKKITIRNWSIPSIYLFNNAEFENLHNILDWNWVINNCVIVEINNSLF